MKRFFLAPIVFLFSDLLIRNLFPKSYGGGG